MAQVNVSSAYKEICTLAISELAQNGTKTVALPIGTNDNFIIQVQDANYQPVVLGNTTVTAVYSATTRLITVTNKASGAFTGKVIVAFLM